MPEVAGGPPGGSSWTTSHPSRGACSASAARKPWTAARIRAALRKRLEPFQGEPSGPYAYGGLGIDYALRRVTLDGEPVELTATEYAVLYEPTVHAPRTLTHAVLLQRIWGPEKVGEPWLVRDMVRRLRRKLGDDADNPSYIITEPRVGYRMAMGEEQESGEEET